ncbi:MAG: family 10 glycosylhydrolase [Duncaniella sp.]|uniref:glycoside hydrolase family 10 protein n=1 Tax=Duncaniella sp. TaxID=2518496 RepID=UPI0023CFAB3C|nr:family 10 glycosylhydrolase [Duncaniella sp.]MDE6090896.1 family 10 glycosylhydrolase [Duncaniella sp.]
MKALIRHFLLAVSFLTVLLPWSQKLHGESPKREMRGVWLATVWGIDWPSVSGTTPEIRKKQMAQLTDILDRCESMNLTSVFFQVRGMSDVMYESSLEPWSSFVSGKRGVSPGWDPLKFVVEECHRRGLECYAWVNPFRWSAGTDYNSEQDREWKRRGWLLTHGKYTVLNPGIEEVRQHIVGICREIVTGYDVDGLVFDDYFYPNRIPEDASAADHGLWREQAPWMDFGDWRRANVHKTIADVHCMLLDCCPEVRFGISPAGVAGKPHTSAPKWGMESCGVKADDWQYKEIYSDPLGWLFQNTIDFISPQIYWPTTHATAPYGPLAQWWSEAASLYGCHFYSSMTLAPLEKTDTPEQRRELLRQVETNRRHSLTGEFGSVLYSAKFLPKLASELSSGHFASKSLTPELRRSWHIRPDTPIDAVCRNGVLRWSDDRRTTGEGRRRYAVYAFPRHLEEDEIMDAGGDGIKSEYLLRVVYDCQTAVPAGLAYAVTTLSGNSLESEPVFVR